MKKLLKIIIIYICLLSSSKTDDIRNLQVEGMSIGDSLLDYFSEREIQENLPYKEWKEKKFNAFEFISTEKFKEYDAIQIAIKPGDKKYIIYSVAGMISYENNFPNCLKKMDEIKKEIDELKNLKKTDFDFTKHRGDKTGKSKYITSRYDFPNKDRILIQCYSWSKEMNQTDHLRIGLRSNEYATWVINEAY